jgi:penicillin amidase
MIKYNRIKTKAGIFLLILTHVIAYNLFLTAPRAAYANPVPEKSPSGEIILNDSYNSIRIIRDEFGVPHIYAKNIFDLYFGYGYITAEDRLFQIETLRRSVSGRVSEVFGKKFIEVDKAALRDGYCAAEIEERIAKLDPLYVKILEMFSAGINKKIGEINKKPAMMPIEFKKFGFSPQPWTRSDVASVYIGTMAVRYSDFTSEMDNMALLKKLEAKFGEKKALDIFNDIVPINDENSPSTITDTANEGNNCKNDNNDNPQPRDIKNGGARGLRGEFNYKNNGLTDLFSCEAASRYRAARLSNAKSLAGLGLPVKLGSYTYLVSGSRSESGAAMLASGPQMGFFNPAYLIEVGLHSPEIDIIGTTTPCYMNIIFGMNRDIAFTATAGVGNLTDVYIEKLNPKNHGEYMHNNEYIKFKKRRFEIKVRGRKHPLKVEFLRSVHGPVFEIDKKAGVAYSKRRAWEGLELVSMFEWMMAVNAKNFGELKYHFSKNPISINMLAINRKGECYNYLSGLYPLRNPDLDDRLPLCGDGTAEWRGFNQPQNNPSSKNEAEGFIANWNSKPLPDFRNGDLCTQWGPDQRTVLIQDYLRKKEKYNMADLYQLQKIIGYTDLRAYIFAPMILEFIGQNPGDGENKALGAVCKILSSWDCQRRDDDGDGRYDSPAAAVFDSLWRELMTGLLADELEDMLWTVDSETFWTQSILLYYALKDEMPGASKKLNYDYTGGAGLKTILIAACERALKTLENEYKTGDTSKWLKPVNKLIFETNNFLSVPQSAAANSIETLMVNRGTENHFIEMGRAYTIAHNLNPPGQSGYIASDPKYSSKHTRDQLDLFIGYKGYKPMRFEISDIIKNKSHEKFIFKN